MTVSAKACSRNTGIDMTLIAEITLVTVPRSLVVEARKPARMKTGIGSPETVGVTMTADSGTGRVIGIMTGRTVFNIIAGGSAMLGHPPQG